MPTPEEIAEAKRIVALYQQQQGGGGGGGGGESKVIEMDPIQIEGDPGPPPTRLENAANQTSSGMTLGLSDYAGAAGDVAGNRVRRAFGSDEPERSFDDAMTHQRAELERGRQMYPESTPLQLAGAMRTGSGVGSALPATRGAQAAGQALVGGVASGNASDWDPAATAAGAATAGTMGYYGGKLGAKAAEQFAAQEAAAAPSAARAAQTMVGRPGAPPMAPGGSSGLWDATKEFAKVAAPGAAAYGGAKALGAEDTTAGLAALAFGGGAAPTMRAAIPVARAAGQAVQGAAPAASGAMSAVTSSATGQAIMGLLQQRKDAAETDSQLDNVRRAFVAGELEPELAAELGDTIENKNRGALAAKYHDLVQTNPELAEKLKRYMRKGASP